MANKITDLDLHTACSNGDGTFSGVKLAQWLFECVAGKPLSEEDAKEIIRQAQQKARQRLAAKEAEK